MAFINHIWAWAGVSCVPSPNRMGIYPRMGDPGVYVINNVVGNFVPVDKASLEGTAVRTVGNTPPCTAVMVEIMTRQKPAVAHTIVIETSE